MAFRQRRKMMRQSLKDLLLTEELVLPERWATKRPEELRPEEFIQLTIDVYGKKNERRLKKESVVHDTNNADDGDAGSIPDAIIHSKSRLLNRLMIKKRNTDAEGSHNTTGDLQDHDADNNQTAYVDSNSHSPIADKSAYVSENVWRKALFG